MAREIEPGSLDEVLERYRNAIRGQGDPNAPIFQQVQQAKKEGGVLDMVEDLPDIEGVETPASRERSDELIAMSPAADVGLEPARRAMGQRKRADGPESTDGQQSNGTLVRGRRCGKALGHEPIVGKGAPPQLTIHDFWAWGYSDVLVNTNRGVLAEFLVAVALGVHQDPPRDAWARYDLCYRDKGIEVKSAAYVQREHQDRPSTISFSVPKTRAYDEKSNLYAKTPERAAAVYVLCLLAERSRDIVNPLNVDQWRFWVLPRAFFDARKRSQHSITYNSLVRECGQPIPFDEVRAAVDKLLESGGPSSPRPACPSDERA